MTKNPKFCPRCGKSLEMRKGTYGTYLDCTDYPKCKYTYELSSKYVAETKLNGKKIPGSCPKCGKKLALYIGKYGIFLGCNGYLKCNYSHNFEDPYNIPCPECGKIMKERSGTYGRFYGCKGYPKCKFTFDLRVKGKTKEKKQSKKLVLPDGYGFSVTGDNILDALTRGGQNLLELANKLELTNKVDINYLKLKLKEFERKGIVVENFDENKTIWKKIK
jgi:ssDNA-binding Zn-finger/Zn-ribbon topoisomerase 1